MKLPQVHIYLIRSIRSINSDLMMRSQSYSINSLRSQSQITFLFRSGYRENMHNPVRLLTLMGTDQLWKKLMRVRGDNKKAEHVSVANVSCCL